MSNSLLAKLAQAQTDEERSWIVTESLLSTLSPELTATAWAAAIPHWFNTDILAALRPELRTQASQLYAELLALPFVEVFPERGHNIHELTRRMILDRLWHENRSEFIALSERAAKYFSGSSEPKVSIDRPEIQIEWLYHLIVVDREWKGSELWDLASKWLNDFRIAELGSLIRALFEQIEADRVATPAKAETYFFAGKTRFRSYQAAEALERYEAALAFYRDIGARLGEANSLQAIGDVLQFLKRSTEALERYEAALAFYRDIGARLGEANSLQAIGDVLQEDLNMGLEYFDAALEIYTQISDKYSQSRNLIYFTSEILLKLGRQEEAIDSLNRAIDLAREINYQTFVENALAKLREIQSEDTTH